MDLDAPEAGFLRQASRTRKGSRQGSDLFRIERPARQSWKIEGTRPFRRADCRIRQRTGMAELKPKMTAAGSTLLRQSGEPARIGPIVEHKVPRSLGKPRITLNLTDDGKRSATDGPPAVEGDLRVSRVSCPVSEAVGHGGLHNTVLQTRAAGKLQRGEEGIVVRAGGRLGRIDRERHGLSLSSWNE
ncbi:hypothetical protein CSE45_2615 [Citreicella sp. SE45]|nr:hypothetical protein CSE45_2615 [Citreicella sp. SE45]